MKTELRVFESSRLERRGAPVTSGVPLPQGCVADCANLALAREDGGPIQCQFTAENRWPDGSLKWVLLDFRLDTSPGEETRLYLIDESPPLFPQTPALACRELPDGFHLRTGAVRAVVPRRGAQWLRDVGVGRSGRIGLSGAPEFRLVATDAGHRPLPVAAFEPDDAVLELDGPERLVIRTRGSFIGSDGKPLFEVVSRIAFHAGLPQARIECTLLQTSDRPLLLLREWALHVALPSCADGKFLFGGSAGIHAGDFRETPTRHATPDEAYGWKTAVLVQASEAAYRFSSADRLGEEQGTRAPAWCDVRGAEFGCTVAVRRFWEEFPKTLTVRGDGTVEIGLWPAQADHPCRMERGAAKTYELLLDFHCGDRSAEACAAAVRDFCDPLFAVASPEWYAASGAFGPLPPFDPVACPEYDGADTLVPEPYRPTPPFGARHFGDRLFGGTTKGKYAFQDLEYDTPLQDFLHFARIGCRPFLVRGLHRALHQADLDTNHATGEQLRHSPLHTTWMPDLGHVTLGGLLLASFLTGRTRLRKTAERIGGWLCAEARGAISRFGSGRHIGWPLIALDQLARETGDPAYAAAAGELVRKLAGVQRPTGEFACTGEGQTDIPFFAGLAAWGVALYADRSGDEQAAEVARKHVDFLLGLYPEYAMRTLPALVWAHRRTGEACYLEFAERTLETCLRYDRRGVSQFAYPYLAWRREQGAAPAPIVDWRVPADALARAPELYGDALAAGERAILRWAHDRPFELLLQRLLPASAGELVLLALDGQPLATLALEAEPRALVQQRLLQLRDLPRGDYALEFHGDAGLLCQVWRPVPIPLVRDCPDGRVAAPVFRVRPEGDRLRVRLEADGEGYKDAALLDPAGTVVLAVDTFIDLDDPATHRSEHTVCVETSPQREGLWRLDLVDYRAVVEGALPFFARSRRAHFVPGEPA